MNTIAMTATRRTDATGETVAVELLPKAAGEFAFACPMGMFRGRLIVE